MKKEQSNLLIKENSISDLMHSCISDYQFLDKIFFMINFKIEKTSKEHEKQIQKLFTESIIDNFKRDGLIEQFPGEINELISEQIHYLNRYFETNGKEEFFLSAISEGKVLGVIAFGTVNKLIIENYGFKPPQYEIKSAYILPSMQGKKIGISLYQNIMKYMKKLDIKTACLDCGYPRSQSFWKKIIGDPIVTKKDFFVSGGDYMIWKIELKSS